MPSVADLLFRAVDDLATGFFGEAVEYTFLDGHSVTDIGCLNGAIESGYQVDGGQVESRAEVNTTSKGVDYENGRTFGFRKSVIGRAKPEIFATVKVVGEGANALPWTLKRITGDEDARWYVYCTRIEKHEMTRPGMRTNG